MTMDILTLYIIITMHKYKSMVVFDWAISVDHAHMRRSRLCSTRICESNRNCIVFIKDDGSDGD